MSLTLKSGDVSGRCCISGIGKHGTTIARTVIDSCYRQMSAWLGRPNLIDQKNLTFKFPNLRLDQSTTEPNLLSPFAHMALQANLGRRIATVMGNANSKADLSDKQVLNIQSECEKLIEELPPIFRFTNADTSFDERHPYFVFQRRQLHCVILLTQLDFLKPYLTRERQDNVAGQDEEFRKKGIYIALRLLKVARKLFDHEFPINAKFHMVVFCIFDTATLLCSAIIHDREHVLPHREEIVDVIESSLEMLQQLSGTTKLGATSFNFLSKLVQATPELSRYPSIGKRQRQTSPSVPKSTSSIPAHEPAPVTTMPSIASVEPATAPVTSNIGDLHSVTISDDLSFDIDQFLAQNPFGTVGDPSAVDMGGMEQIWDWQDLHLDAYAQEDQHGWNHNGSG